MESVEGIMVTKEFFQGKRVFITGHTGFKGSWMCKVLHLLGAEICGYALQPNTRPNLFEVAGIEKHITSIFGDVRNREILKQAVCEFSPEIVIHMAAQPLVRDSYVNPAYTYETNVMGTVNVLEAVRNCNSVKSFVNVTTDKVYKNREWPWGYRETDEIDGYDPYSNSKSCSELVTGAYKKSFFNLANSPAISTARAGNVIGGGDFAADRIIPDCFRALQKNETIIVRNPNSIRPYEHVLEPVVAYLMIAEKQYDHKKYSGSYNIGPNEEDCLTTGELVTLFCEECSKNVTWKNIQEANAPHEAGFLKLDHSYLASTFGWKPRWNIRQAITKTIDWYQIYISGGCVEQCMEQQIQEYMEGR